MKTKAEVIAHVKTLVANKKLDAKHLTVLEAATDDVAVAMGAMLVANAEAPAAAAPAAPAAPATAAPAVNAATPLTADDVKAMISDGITKGFAALSAQIPAMTERTQLISEITANSANAFTGPELQAMQLDSLKKYANSLRPADYSGQGGGPVVFNEGAEALGAPVSVFGAAPAAKQ